MFYDPLATWRADAARGDESVVGELAEVRALLARIPRYLALHAGRAARAPLPRFSDDPIRRRDLAVLGVPAEPRSVRLPPDELRTAQRLYTALFTEACGDEPLLEQWLLHMIGFTNDPASIPFWIETLGRAGRPDDPLGRERRAVALAALAYLAATHDADEAYDALRDATRADAPDARAAAAVYLVGAHRLARRAVGMHALEAVTRLAREDRALEPRHVARALLESDNLPVPIDYPDGVYTLRATHAGSAAAPFALEVRCVQSLAHVHVGIARAVGRDAAVRYAFLLAGDFERGRYVVSSEPGRVGRSPGEVLLGDLGLLPGHVFRYVATPPETERYVLDVAALRPEAEPGAVYPRQVGRRATGAAVVAAGGQGGGALVLRSPHIFVLQTHVNGTRHYEAPRVAAQLKRDEAVRLRREPTNSYDDRAIEVLTRAYDKLGYVPRNRNRVLAQMMDGGEVLFGRVQAVDVSMDTPFVLIDVYAKGQP